MLKVGRVFGILSGLYFIVKVIYYGVIQFMGSSSLSVQYGAIMQVLEFFFLTGILVIFRSRRFPPFYTIGLNEINVRMKNYLINYRIHGWMEITTIKMQMLVALCLRHSWRQLLLTKFSKMTWSQVIQELQRLRKSLRTHSKSWLWTPLSIQLRMKMTSRTAAMRRLMIHLKMKMSSLRKRRKITKKVIKRRKILRNQLLNLQQKLPRVTKSI